MKKIVYNGYNLKKDNFIFHFGIERLIISGIISCIAKEWEKEVAEKS